VLFQDPAQARRIPLRQGQQNGLVLLRRVWTTFREAAWALLLPVIILGGIFGGIVTATEGAGLAVVAALLIGGLVYRELDWPTLRDAMIDGAVQTTVVMLLVNSVGIDPVHFGLMVTLNLGIGQQTPPVASVLITACSVAKAGIGEVSKVNVNFIAVLLAVLVMVTCVPAVPMGLVECFYR
jgi:TRAP-type C4-dicarboxylate transport system permease large subunit